MVGVEAAGDGQLRVDVRWADGTTTEWTVVGEDGPRICGAVPD